jgi:hypothetical protein
LPLRDNNDAGGTLTTSSGQGSWTSNGRNYIQHNSTTNKSGVFTFTWNAPAFSDTIIFYSGGLAANGANGNANDYVYTGTTAVLPITPITFTEDSATTSCLGNCDGTASVTVSGGGVPPYSYLWSSGETTDTITGKCTGTYTVTITDDKEHEEVAEIEIKNPEPIVARFNVSPSSCAFGDGEISVSVSGGSGPYTYQWNDSASTTDSVIFQASLGWFTVTITDSVGCTTVDSSEIFQSSSGVTGFCQNDNESCGLSDGISILNMFAGNPPYSFDWSTGSNSNISTNLIAGTYSVTVTDNIGCTQSFSTEISEDFVTINSNNTILTEASCFNGKDGRIKVGVDDGDNPFTFLWSHDTLASGSQLSDLNAGEDTITVIDDVECRDSASFAVLHPDSVYTETQVVGSNEGFCDGSLQIEMFGGTPAYSFSWPHDNNSTNAEATELCSGNYIVTTTDAKNCLFLINTLVPELLTVQDINALRFSFFPNPAVDQISLTVLEPSSIQIINIGGQIVWSGNIVDSELIDLARFDSDTYSIMLKSKTTSSSKVLNIGRE